MPLTVGTVSKNNTGILNIRVVRGWDQKLCHRLIFTVNTSGKTESTPCMCSPFSHLSIDVSTTHVDAISLVKYSFAQRRLGKMVGKSVENAYETRPDIRTRSLLNRGSTDIYADNCTVYSSYLMSFSSLQTC